MDDLPPTIDSSQTIAVVGVSRKKTKFGSIAYRTLKRKGYRVFPVHPQLDTFDDDPCYHRITDIPESVHTVLVTSSPENVRRIVDDACSKSVRRLWFQQGADYSSMVTAAKDKGLQAVTDRCVLMYADDVGSIHAFHRFIWKILRKY